MQLWKKFRTSLTSHSAALSSGAAKYTAGACCSRQVLQGHSNIQQANLQGDYTLRLKVTPRKALDEA